MEDSSWMSPTPRTFVSLWLGAVLPLVAGLASGGLALALGCAFAAACPVLVILSLRWSAQAERLFPLYFLTLFLIALTGFEFNSAAFVVDTWSALLVGLLVMPATRPESVDLGAVAGPG